jgi:hypothetical protein
MDYEEYISYRDEIIEISKEVTNNARVSFDGEGYITIIKDDSIGHFQIDDYRNRDSFKIYDGQLDDELGGRVDPIFTTDHYKHAKQEWKVYLNENMAKD